MAERDEIIAIDWDCVPWVGPPIDREKERLDALCAATARFVGPLRPPARRMSLADAFHALGLVPLDGA